MKRTVFRSIGWLTVLVGFTAGAAVDVGTSQANDGPDRWTDRIDSLVRARMSAAQIPGVAVVVVRDGKVVHARAYGTADLATGRPVSLDSTIFRFGSVSKFLTMLGVLRLVERGVIDLDDPVAKHVPLPEHLVHRVTVRDLLAHTGGFDQVGTGRQVVDPAARQSLPEFLRESLRPIRVPAQVGVYDTYGATLAGLLIEAASGRPYAEFMRDEVFAPAGMHSTGVELGAVVSHRRATGYNLDDILAPADYEWYVTTPASSIDGTASDMGRLLQALLAREPTALGPAWADRILTERPSFDYGGFGGFAWGLWEGRLGGHQMLHHGGIMAGYSAELLMVPRLRSGFFIAYNRDPETGPDPRLREELTTLFGELLPSATVVRPMPPPRPDVVVAEYLGVYASMVGCFTCDEGEGWPLATTRVGSAGAGTITVGRTTAHAIGNDHFVRDTPQPFVAFLRDGQGKIQYMVTGPDSYVRMDSLLIKEVHGVGWERRPPTTLEARVHRANEHWPQSAEAYASLADRNTSNGRFAFYAGYGHLNALQGDSAVAWFSEAIRRKQWVTWSGYYVAAGHLVAGRTDSAAAHLRSAIDQGFGDAGMLENEPWWEPVRDTPWYKEALARMR